MYSPVQTTPFSLKEKLLNRLWSIVNRTVFRFSPFFMRKLRVFMIRSFGAKVDYTCSLDKGSLVNYPWNLEMGAFSSLAENAYLSCDGHVRIGQKVCIGRGVNVLSGSHDIHSNHFELVTRDITIEDNVWIATGSIILPGIRIEQNSVVAAGSVVVKNISANDVVGGNPARFIKKRSFHD